MTSAGFPHSEISGSSLVCQLPEAYRRLLRLSSPPDAKASTLCPSLLTNALAVLFGELTLRPGSTEPASSSIPYAATNLFIAGFQGTTVPESLRGSGPNRRRPLRMNLTGLVGPVVENQVAVLVISPALDAWPKLRAVGSLKEVIQPQVPLRLPCYDFTPIIDQTVDGSLPKGWVTGFGSSQLSWCDGRCVQGPGTYSPRHADPRLLAIPTSWSRVADSNPN